MIYHKRVAGYFWGTRNATICRCDTCKYEVEIVNSPYGWHFISRPKGKQNHYCCDECRDKGMKK